MTKLTNQRSPEEGGFYGELFDCIGSPIFVVDLQTTAILNANKTACSFYGYERSEMLQKKISDLAVVSMEDIQVRTPKIAAGEITRMSLHHRLANGEVRDVEVDFGLGNLEGRPVNIVTVHDVTAREQAKKELQESEKNYRLLFQNMSEGFSHYEVIKNENGEAIDARILAANAAYENHTGLNPAKVVGRTVLEVMPQTGREQIEPYFKVAQTGKPTSREFFSTVFQRFYHTKTYRPQPGQFASIVEDITERKLAEQELAKAYSNLQKALKIKNEFMAAMSSELRTPLTSIIGITEMLQMSLSRTSNEKELNHVAVIEKSGQRILDIVNNILSFTQLQGGDAQADLHSCGLDHVCKVALQKVTPLAEKKQQQVQFAMTPPDIRILTDEIQLDKILHLLLDNASKFTDEDGEFGIEVTGRCDAKLVDITVWDTGIGIAEEDLPRLFKPFTQLDSSLTRQYEGTGLGLALVKGLTELLGGEVHVQSSLDKGSRFTVTLPWKVEN